MYNVLDVCHHIINYSNKCDYGISNLKLQKILYFVQAYFLINTEKPCFAEKIEAWDFGPVVREAYQEYKQYGAGDIPTITSYFSYDSSNSSNFWNWERVTFSDDVISDKDKKLIDQVVDKFSVYSATDLVSLTHRQSPWIDAYEQSQNNEIKLDSIRKYFDE